MSDRVGVLNWGLAPVGPVTWAALNLNFQYYHAFNPQEHMDAVLLVE